MGSSTDENKHGEGVGGWLVLGVIVAFIYVAFSVVFTLAILAILAVFLGLATLPSAAMVYAVSGIVYRGAVSFRRALGPTFVCLGITAGSAFAFLTILVEIRPPFECRNGLHDLPMLSHCMHRRWAHETDLAIFFLLFPPHSSSSRPWRSAPREVLCSGSWPKSLQVGEEQIPNASPGSTASCLWLVWQRLCLPS